MIKLYVAPYCEECLEFEPEVERPEVIKYRGYSADGRIVEYCMPTDTIIRCKYRDRCRALSKYIEQQKKGE